jgi:hypothetical protein
MRNIICMSEREIDAYLLCLCDTHSADVDRKSGFVVASYLWIPLITQPWLPFDTLPGDAHTHQSCLRKSLLMTPFLHFSSHTHSVAS